MTADQNLERLGIALPPPPPAVANYVAWVRTGNLIVTSGQLPWEGESMRFEGRLGAELSIEEGYEASRLAAINGIAQLKQAAGDLERVVRIVRIEGNVHCALGFQGHPQVLNGASDLMVEVFEERGRHTRSALGVHDMPLNAAVQLNFWAELRPDQTADALRRASANLRTLSSCRTTARSRRTARADILLSDAKAQPWGPPIMAPTNAAPRA